MTPPWWAWIFVVLVVTVLIGGPALGVVRFNRRVAEHVRAAEVQDRRAFQQHVVQVVLAHPDIVRTCREDRHPWYLLTHVGVLAYAVSLFAGCQLTAPIAAMGNSTRITLGIGFMVGSALVLAGAALGAQIGRLTIMPSVHDHLTSDVIGDDIVLPYRIAMAGMSATATSALIYADVSFGDTISELGEYLTAAIVASCCITIPWFWSRVRTFSRNDALLIAEARERLARSGRECNDVGD